MISCNTCRGVFSNLSNPSCSIPLYNDFKFYCTSRENYFFVRNSFLVDLWSYEITDWDKISCKNITFENLFFNFRSSHPLKHKSECDETYQYE